MAETGTTSTRRAWAEIDLDALRGNLARAKALAGDQAQVAAVIKADAYGHGIERVAKALADDVAFLAVAALSEAAAIHPGAAKILIMGPCLPEEMPEVIARDWRPCLSSREEVEAARAAARNLGKTARVHLVADTGMGRIGALESEFAAFHEHVSGIPELAIEGVASHLPSADEDSAYTAEQIERFERLVAGLRRRHEPPLVHVLNSAGLLRFPPRLPRLVRPGLMLYGVSPEPTLQEGLREVMQLKTRVRLVRWLPVGHGVSYGRTCILPRPTLVATLGVGYGDGYFRAVSGRRAAVLLAGRRCPLLGRVTMDQIMVDVTDLGRPVALGEEAVLFGQQNGQRIAIREVADWAGTIPWEILTSITQRVPRMYVGV